LTLIEFWLFLWSQKYYYNSIKILWQTHFSKGIQRIFTKVGNRSILKFFEEGIFNFFIWTGDFLVDFFFLKNPSKLKKDSQKERVWPQKPLSEYAPGGESTKDIFLSQRDLGLLKLNNYLPTNYKMTPI